MRLAPTLLVVAALLGTPVAAQAQTSINSLLGLKAAGFSDDLLIATFRSDGTVFYLTADDLIYLRQQGMSEKVLIAMLATRAPAQAPPPLPVPPANAVTSPAATVRNDPDPPDRPVVVNVDQHVSQRVEVEAPRTHTVTQTVYVPVVTSRPRSRPSAERAPAPSTVYWGFGGQRRPGTWGPSTPTRAKPAGGGEKEKPTGRGGGSTEPPGTGGGSLSPR